MPVGQSPLKVFLLLPKSMAFFLSFSTRHRVTTPLKKPCLQKSGSTVCIQSEVALQPSQDRVHIWYQKRSEVGMTFFFPAENHLAKVWAVLSTFRVGQSVIDEGGSKNHSSEAHEWTSRPGPIYSIQSTKLSPREHAVNLIITEMFLQTKGILPSASFFRCQIKD